MSARWVGVGALPPALLVVLSSTLSVTGAAAQEEGTAKVEQRVIVVTADGSDVAGRLATAEVGEDGLSYGFRFESADGAVEEGIAEADVRVRRQVRLIESSDDEANGVFVVRLDASADDDLQSGNTWIFDAMGAPAFLGVEVLPMTDALRRYFGVPAGLGILVSEVVDDSPAFRIDLRAGDVLTAIDGAEISTTHRLRAALAEAGPDRVIDLEIWRGGSVLHRSTELEERLQKVVELRGDGSSFLHVEADKAAFTGDDMHTVDLDLDGVTIEVREFLHSGVWQEEMNRIRDIDVEALERRIRDLEQQIQRLEEELAEPR